jgi:hypothetical protein
MALTRSKPASIFTPEGNSLAVFIDVADGTLKLKDVFGGVELFSDIAGGAGLKLKDDALMTTTLTEVADKDNTPSILSISTESVGIGTTTSTGLLNLFKPSAAVRLMINGDAGQNRLITYRTGGLQRFGLYVNNTAESGSNVGSDFAIRRYTDGGTLGGTPFFIKRSTGNVGINNTTPATTLDVNGTANIAERLTIEADSTATTQSTAVIQNTTTNSGIALVPNGTGAITADIPDGTATGGNARGANAVDLQMLRSAANQVAGGVYSVISGGRENLIYAGPNGYSFIGGGQNNINGYGGHSVIVGGLNNTATQPFGMGASSYHFIGGGFGNTTSSLFSTISGGQSNTASTGTHATVVGGQSNVSSGAHSVSGGFTNTASGNESTAFGRSNIVSGSNGSFAGGQQNNVSGAFNAAFCSANGVSGSRNFAAGGSNSVSGNDNAAFGFSNSVSGTLASFAVGNGNNSSNYGFVSGSRGVTIGYASRVLSNNSFNELASSQIREMIASRQAELISGATTTLSLDGTGVTNLISTLYGNNRMWNVTLKYVAVVQNITGIATGVTIGDIKTQTIELGIKRVITVSSIVGAGNFSTPQEDTSMSSASLIPSIVGDDLILTFTAPTFAGGGSVTVRVVSKVELVEVGFV